MIPLADQIEALLDLNAKGAVSHPVPGLAVELLTKAAQSLRAQGGVASLEASPAPVSEEKMWRAGTAMKGTDPSLIHPDDKGHRTRFSDSSYYDEVCVLCGATDGRGDNRLDKPCPNALAAKGGQ